MLGEMEQEEEQRQTKTNIPYCSYGNLILISLNAQRFSYSKTECESIQKSSSFQISYEKNT